MLNMQYYFILCNLKINNAGCMVNQRELTEEGLEKNFATNALGKEKTCSWRGCFGGIRCVYVYTVPFKTRLKTLMFALAFC